MKKLIAFLMIGVLLAVSGMGVVSALVLDQAQPTGSVLIRTTYDESDIQYAVQIPADTMIPWTAEHTGLTYTPTLMRLERNKKVTVSVAGQNGTLRQNPADTSETGIPYVLSGTVTAEFFHGQVGAGYAQDFFVDITAAAWDAAAVGHYQDQVIFTIAYVDA